jgi:RNase P/RNase MRP subunit p30
MRSRRSKSAYYPTSGEPWNVRIMSEILDLNVCTGTQHKLDSFISMAQRLGFTGLATAEALKKPIMRRDDGFLLLQRYDLHRLAKRSMKNQLGKIRNETAIVSAPLGNASMSNWAAEDSRIDLITPIEPYTEHRLKRSTAKLAASTNTALEIPVRPLLKNQGMNRARILKMFRESVNVARSVSMPIVISSYADIPLLMRAPRALQYIGYLLGLMMAETKVCVRENPAHILSTNERKLEKGHLSEGIEILEGQPE